MPINIRAATSDDLNEIAAIHKSSILVLCESHYSSSDRDAAWTADLAPERYQTFHESDGYLLLAATDGDAEDDSAKSQGNNLLGFGILDLRRGIINAVYVRPSAAGQGVGRAIVEALEREALSGNLPG